MKARNRRDAHENIRGALDSDIQMTTQRLPSSIRTRIRLISIRLHKRTQGHRQCPCHESLEYLAERSEAIVEDAFGERVDEFGEDGDEDDYC